MFYSLGSALCAPPPVRVTIDCSSNEDSFQYSDMEFEPRRNFNVNSFCNMIQRAIPKTIKNGRFVRVDSDQFGDEDTEYPRAMAPPPGYIPKLPKFKKPKLVVPKLNIPKLQPSKHKSKVPKLMIPKFDSLRQSDEESSAERMEIFKNGVQKLLNVVKVLGQIDQYLSERTRIIVDKLSKTFAD